MMPERSVRHSTWPPMLWPRLPIASRWCGTIVQLVAKRCSVRSFSDCPIEPEKMVKILKAGQLAPTAVNFQPQKIYILKSKAAIDKIRSLTRFAYNAPVVLLFCANTSKAWRSSFELCLLSIRSAYILHRFNWKRIVASCCLLYN